MDQLLIRGKQGTIDTNVLLEKTPKLKHVIWKMLFEYENCLIVAKPSVLYTVKPGCSDITYIGLGLSSFLYAYKVHLLLKWTSRSQ